MAGRVTAPKIDLEIAACEYAEWRRFAPFHYLTRDLNRAARCFAAYVDHQPVAFAGILHRPVSRSWRTGQNLMGVSRVVTLPDWQGLGIAFTLIDTIGGAYKAIGRRLNNYPTHPSFVRSSDRSPHWALIARPGFSMSQRGGTDLARRGGTTAAAVPIMKWRAGTRPCATFRYVGPALHDQEARLLLRPYIRDVA